MRNFEELEVWQKAHGPTVKLYRLTESFPRSEMFGLTSQIRRAAGSIGANLAEGCGRWSEGELARFIQIAMGSASERQNHIRLARDLEFLNSDDYRNVLKDVVSVRQMLTALLQVVRGVRPAKSKSPLTSGEKPTAKSE
jgi:four helix bundle protein